MVEITSGNLELAIQELGINATKTYQGTENEKHPYQEVYQVWELNEIDYEKLCNISEDAWKDEYGWWRSAKGSNMMGTITGKFIVNGKEIEAWYGNKRENFENELEEHIEDYSDGYEENFENLAEFEEYVCGEKKYDNILEYFCEEIGASTERNVCALAIDLAKINNMKMSELFKIYQG